jgi:hypothetical protein
MDIAVFTVRRQLPAAPSGTNGWLWFRRIRMFRRVLNVLLILAGLANVTLASSADSTQVALLRSQLKHKFVLDFLERMHAQNRYYRNEEIRDMEHDSLAFLMMEPPGEYAIESFFYYYLRVDLYLLKPFDGHERKYLMTLYIGGLAEIFLFESDEHGNILLDTLDLDLRSEAHIRQFRLNDHNFILLTQTSYGTGSKDEHEDIIAVINNRFQSVFSISLLEASDWMMRTDTATNDFVRRTRKLAFQDMNGDGYLDIRVSASEDVIHMGKGVESFDFRNGVVKKHLKNWTEVYIWDEKTETFNPTNSR